jgi:uncharacterized protein (TIGR03790 family)
MKCYRIDSTGSTLLLLCLLLAFVTPAAARVDASQLAIVVNSNDIDSRLIADYYQKKRDIPAQNVIEVQFTPGKNSISAETFRSVYQQLIENTPAAVQYYALAWTQPYKVGCMSVTSAFAFGYDERFCAKGCRRTQLSNYYNADTDTPMDDIHIRPTMMLAGSSSQQVKAMIDRGVSSDASAPEATAYLLSTSDRARNARAWRYPVIQQMLSDKIAVEIISGDVLHDKDDVMFYFTGLKKVDAIDSNRFLPGAIADHLTSYGGRLTGSTQMSILRWLDAGATASYGTVVEPCAFTQKFPNPGIVIQRYLNGESLIQAYWKSVAWPGQGVFVGEPLAAPYAAIETAPDKQQ